MFTLPATKPVLTWQTCGAGDAGGARVEMGKDITITRAGGLFSVALHASIAKTNALMNRKIFRFMVISFPLARVDYPLGQIDGERWLYPPQ